MKKIRKMLWQLVAQGHASVALGGEGLSYETRWRIAKALEILK